MMQIRIAHHRVLTYDHQSLDLSFIGLVYGFGQGQAVVGRQRYPPCGLELGADGLIGHRLVSRIGNRQASHVTGTLHVVLTSQGINPGSRPADIAGKHGQVADGFYIVSPGTVLGKSHGITDDSRLSFGIYPGGLSDVLRRHRSDLLHVFRCVLGYYLGHRLITFCTVGYELLVSQPFSNDDVHHSVNQGYISTRQVCHIHVRQLRQVGAARIGDNQFGTPVKDVLLNLHPDNRVILCRIRTDYEDAGSIFF